MVFNGPVKTGRAHDAIARGVLAEIPRREVLHTDHARLVVGNWLCKEIEIVVEETVKPIIFYCTNTLLAKIHFNGTFPFLL